MDKVGSNDVDGGWYDPGLFLNIFHFKFRRNPQMLSSMVCSKKHVLLRQRLRSAKDIAQCYSRISKSRTSRPNGSQTSPGMRSNDEASASSAGLLAQILDTRLTHAET